MTNACEKPAARCWQSAYDDLIKRVGQEEVEGRSIVHRYPVLPATEGERQIDAVLFMRNERGGVLSFRFAFPRVKVDDIDLHEMHRQARKPHESGDPHAWALRRMRSPLSEIALVRQVVLDTSHREKDLWAAYVSTLTDEVVYGSIAPAALVDLMEMLRHAPPHHDVIRQYVLSRRRALQGSLEEFLFLGRLALTAPEINGEATYLLNPWEACPYCGEHS